MDEMPDFETSHETPALAPKKQRRKPMKMPPRTKREKKMTMMAPVKRKKRQKIRVQRAIISGRKVLAESRGMNHTEFMAAFDVVTSLAKFDNDAKKRILIKAAEAWT
jgi:hypothetical protein